MVNQWLIVVNQWLIMDNNCFFLGFLLKISRWTANAGETWHFSAEASGVCGTNLDISSVVIQWDLYIFLNSKKCSNIYLNKVIDGHQSWFFTLSGWWFQTFSMAILYIQSLFGCYHIWAWFKMIGPQTCMSRNESHVKHSKTQNIANLRYPAKA